MFIPYPKEVDKSKYAKELKDPEVFYGLPKDVKFCRSCVISNQRPSSTVEFKARIKQKKSTIAFDENCICDACAIRLKKSQINWEERENQLRELCDKYRSNDGKYDCLVPGSGGKDSFMQAHLLKYKYGMNPLTATWAPHIYTDWGWKNHQAWIHAGFDNILFTPNGRVHRLISRLAIDNIFHPFQPFIIGQKNLAPKIAARYDIPLIFYGENEAEYGNPKANMNSSTMLSKFFTATNQDEIFLGGTSLKQLKELGLNSSDWEPYLPINPEILESKKIEFHYLGYYEKWHPQSAYYYAVKHGGFRCAPERSAGTYSTYSSIDDRVDDFQYHTTYIKFGIGRATYDAAQEVRSGDILREEGTALVKKFDGEFPERWAEEVFNYLSINEKEFPEAFKHFERPNFNREYYELLCDNARSPHLWYWDEIKGWNLRSTVFDNENIIEQNQNAANWEGNKVR